MDNIKNIVTFFTQSSEDPAKTSATLTGILIALASYLHQYAVFIPIVNKFFASPLAQQTDAILSAIGMILGSVWFLFGLFRKATNKVESKLDNKVE